MRNTFINRLCALAEDQMDIFLLCGDLGYSILEPFAERFPERFLNVGIAEQNMICVAAGLAAEGYNVFCYSIGNFTTLRCMEQIRYDICYHSANVKIVAVGAGYAYGPQGVSHHTTEDIAMLRVLPGMLVCSPADAVEASLIADFMAKHKGSAYVRINKSGEPILHSSPPSGFSPGKLIPIKDGSSRLVLATGAILSAVKAELCATKSDWALYSAPFIGNYDRELMLSLVSRFEHLVTLEEHQLNGGFGSSILECVSDLYSSGALEKMPKIKRIAVHNLFIGKSGTQDYLRQEAGLTLGALS